MYLSVTLMLNLVHVRGTQWNMCVCWKHSGFSMTAKVKNKIQSWRYNHMKNGLT